MNAKVLIVDDDKDILWSLEEELSSAGFDVKTANSGGEALSVLENEPVDFMVVDLKMPDMNGIDLLLTAKDKYPDIKVIVITAYGSDEVREEVLKKGAIKYLEKPFGVDELIKAIEEQATQEAQSWEITEVLQLIALEGKSADVEVDLKEGKGVIHLREGEVYNATYNDLKGEEAFYKILEENPANFKVKWTKTPVERRIEKPLYALLIAVVARKDEIIKDENLEEMVKEAIKSKDETAEKKAEKPEEFEPDEEAQKILEELFNRDSSIVAVGMVDEKRGVFSLSKDEKRGEITGKTLRELIYKLNELPGDELKEIIVVKSPYLLVARHSEDKTFFILSSAAEKLGILRVFLKNLNQ